VGAISEKVWGLRGSCRWWEENFLSILVQRRGDRAAARKFFGKLLKRCRCVSRVIVTDRLKSYGAAKQEIPPGVEHRQHKYLNNRAENSHQPTRQQERRMQGLMPQDTLSGSLRRTVASCNTATGDGIGLLPLRTV
jgi:transposase-like protein